MRVAIVGFGSVGRRHAANAQALGCDVVLVRRRTSGNGFGLPEVPTIDDAEADAIIIATPTALHAPTLLELGERRVPVLCEKPLCATRAQADAVWPIARRQGANWRVALQLRFHPLVEAARSLVRDGAVGPVRYVHSAVGQYLPDWRPGRDHLDTYSASTAAGGGVLLDLVHEIDLASCLAGAPAGDAVGLSARVGDVTIDSDDVADVVWMSESGALVHVHLDYLYRGLLRETVIIGAEGTLRLDLSAATLSCLAPDGRSLERRDASGFERNDMFLALLREFISGLEVPASCRLPTAEEHLRLQSSLWTILHHEPYGKS